MSGNLSNVLHFQNLQFNSIAELQCKIVHVGLQILGSQVNRQGVQKLA